jgi:hypothetical protein
MIFFMPASTRNAHSDPHAAFLQGEDGGVIIPQMVALDRLAREGSEPRIPEEHVPVVQCHGLEAGLCPIIIIMAGIMPQQIPTELEKQSEEISFYFSAVRSDENVMHSGIDEVPGFVGDFPFRALHIPMREVDSFQIATNRCE